MAAPTHVLAIDQGTSSTRAMIFNAAGAPVAIDQREHAQLALRHVHGIRSIESAIDISHKAIPADIKARIQAALKRSALIEASGIKVEADGDAVILSGKVRSWTERDEVERAAWMAPGITAVTNQLQVGS